MFSGRVGEAFEKPEIPMWSVDGKLLLIPRLLNTDILPRVFVSHSDI